ncbi:hypothetical protein OUZ56_033011 [Daphnia magna]|uniref:Uncharacterized protein n=1 Tax=Daphnia magna TaxID=35525 RepID=A0ABR0BA07_9CRUS|nr:hypothetical protein OUZ56_033011 [Daphnia magna]
MVATTVFPGSIAVGELHCGEYKYLLLVLISCDRIARPERQLISVRSGRLQESGWSGQPDVLFLGGGLTGHPINSPVGLGFNPKQICEIDSHF